MNSARAQLKSALERYANRYPAENRCVSRMLDLLSLPSAFERGCLQHHFTASAWILDPSRELVLLTHHKKLGIWVQLGGHADGQEDLWQVALREAREESGLAQIELLSSELFDCDIHAIPRYKEVAAHEHFDVAFLFATEMPETLQLSEESHALRWVPMSDAAFFKGEERMQRFIQKTQQWRSATSSPAQ